MNGESERIETVQREGISMCSDAQHWMTEEPAAHTCEGKSLEVLALASVVVGDDRPEPSSVSESRIGRGVRAGLQLLARALGARLMNLLRQGRKGRAHFRENALSHPRRESVD